MTATPPVERPLLKVEKYVEVVVERPVTHQEVVIRQVAYSVQDVMAFLDMSYDGVLRLIRAGQLRARHNGRRYIIAGSAIHAYLDGADEPMHHQDTA